MKIIQVTSNADGDIMYGLGDDGEIYEYAAERLPWAGGWRYYWTKHGTTEPRSAIDNLTDAMLRHAIEWPLPFAHAVFNQEGIKQVTFKDKADNHATGTYYTEEGRLVISCNGTNRVFYWRNGKWTQ